MCSVEADSFCPNIVNARSDTCHQFQLLSDDMSIHLPPPTLSEFSNDPTSDLESSDSDLSDSDQDWNDWISDSDGKQKCRSLFDDTVLPSVDEALIYDKETHNFSLNDFCKTLCALTVFHSLVLSDFCSALDFHSRVRLINFIRRNVRFKF